MLEILFIWHFCKRMGEIMRAKGRRPGGYQFMLVGMWIGGEILGGVIGALMLQDSGLFVYLFAIAGAITGVVSAFAIAKNATPATGFGGPTGGFPVIMSGPVDSFARQNSQE